MLKIIITAGALSAAVAALAQAPSNTPTQSAGQNADPNQIVCVNERDTGSRVATRRVCRTRAEWAEHNAEQRRTLDRVQGFRPVVCGDAASGATRNVC
jgi:hypothetical protein